MTDPDLTNYLPLSGSTVKNLHYSRTANCDMSLFLSQAAGSIFYLPEQILDDSLAPTVRLVGRDRQKKKRMEQTAHVLRSHIS